MAGGEAIQVSKEAGLFITESRDGKWLYFYYYDGNIWKLSLGKGLKQLVLNGIGNFDNWDLAQDGIYYIKRSSDGNGSYIQFLSFSANSIRKLATLKQKNIISFDISPNRGSFLINEHEINENDIYLVENFR